jgi:dipeptidyl aminopeptidase/acylaminoacyl peptidase
MMVRLRTGLERPTSQSCTNSPGSIAPAETSQMSAKPLTVVGARPCHLTAGVSQMYRRVEGDWDIWVLDVERGVVSRFTLDAGNQVNPIWSPDGRRIVYLWRGTRASQLYQKPTDAAGKEEPILVTDEDKSPSDWSPDGRYVLYRNTDAKTGEDVWALPVQGDRKPFPVVQTNFNEQDGQFSPDGRWLAYQSDQSGPGPSRQPAPKGSTA